MSSSKVMMSSWSPTRQPSPSRLNLDLDRTRGFGSINFDDIFRNICADSQPFALDSDGEGVGDGFQEETVGKVWREIVSVGAGRGGGNGPEMTLEDFLTKAGAVDEEDVRVPATASETMPPPLAGRFVMEVAMMSSDTVVPAVQFAPVDLGNVMATAGGGGKRYGRGKRKASVEQVALDKATQQRQRRMIKNRESAARSRERKQAYTMELETLLTQLENYNARLLQEEAELKKQRYEQLMKSIIPVTEKSSPLKAMKKVHSMEW